MCGCDDDVICVEYDLTRCSGWWYVCSINVKLCGLENATLGSASFNLTLYGCEVSVCCIGFVSLSVVYDELYDCAWNVGL